MERTALTGLRVDLQEGVSLLCDSEQAVEIGYRLFERAIQNRDAARNFLAAGPLVILRGYLEIIVRRSITGR